MNFDFIFPLWIEIQFNAGLLDGADSNEEVPCTCPLAPSGQMAKRYLKGYIEALEKYGTE